MARDSCQRGKRRRFKLEDGGGRGRKEWRPAVGSSRERKWREGERTRVMEEEERPIVGGENGSGGSVGGGRLGGGRKREK